MARWGCWFTGLWFLFLVLLQSLTLASEVRGLWVTRWDYQSQDDIFRIVQNAKHYNFNVLFFQVRGNATVYYPSRLEPFAGGPACPDPLRIVIDEAHRAGLELHAWLNVFPGWAGTKPPRDRQHLFYEHPDWFMCDVNRQTVPLNEHYTWLSPTHPEVQRHNFRICQELLQNYAVDGLHLDYIRYPGPGFSYDQTSVNRFKQRYQKTPQELPDEWNQFRRNSITWFIHHLYRLLQKKHPHITLSAAVTQNPFTRKYLFFQDAHRWLAAGIVDFICPMLYTTDNTLFEQRLQEYLAETHGRFIFPGIMVENPNQLRTQIEITRRNGMLGQTLFAYQKLFPQHQSNELAAILRNELYDESTNVPEFFWKDPFCDSSGPFVEKVLTHPLQVIEKQPFHIFAKIKDPSGVFDDSTGSNGLGVYLNWTTPEGNLQERQMSRWPYRQHVFRTDTPVLAPLARPNFEFRIYAHDNTLNQDSLLRLDLLASLNESTEQLFPLVKRHPNSGYSELQSIAIYPENAIYEFEKPFGPPIYKLRGLAVDGAGKVWVIDGKAACIRIFNANGIEVDFSPISQGKQENGGMKRLQQPSSIAIDARGVVYVGVNSGKNIIYKFEAHTGTALSGFHLAFSPGQMAIDQNHRLYVTRNWGNRWYILDEFGSVLFETCQPEARQFQDIAVSPDGHEIFVVAGITGHLLKWGYDAEQRTYIGRSKGLNQWENIGGVYVDAQNRLFVAQTYQGRVLVLDASEQLLDILPRREEPLAGPRYLATSGEYLFFSELGAESPIQIQQWRLRPESVKPDSEYR